MTDKTVNPNHVAALTRRHRSLDIQIQAEERHLHQDDILIGKLKRKKLELKDEITRLTGGFQSHIPAAGTAMFNPSAGDADKAVGLDRPTAGVLANVDVGHVAVSADVLLYSGESAEGEPALTGMSAAEPSITRIVLEQMALERTAVA